MGPWEGHICSRRYTSRQHLPCLLASDAVPADFFFHICPALLSQKPAWDLFSSPILMRVAALSPQGEWRVLLAWGVWACLCCSDSLWSSDVPRLHVLHSLFQIGHAPSVICSHLLSASAHAHTHTHTRLRAELRLTVVLAIPTLTHLNAGGQQFLLWQDCLPPWGVIAIL